MIVDVACVIGTIEEYALARKKADRDLSSYALSDACREVGESIQSMQRATARGNPTLLTVVRLAFVLGVELHWLLGGGELHNVEWLMGEQIND